MQDFSHINQTLLPVGFKTLNLSLTGESYRFGFEYLSSKDQALKEAVYRELGSSQFTGFVASFYRNGQLARFIYFIDGGCEYSPHLGLSHRVDRAGYSILTYYLRDRVFEGSGYGNGLEEDHNLWSDNIPGRPKDYGKWLEESIDSVVFFGINDQLLNTDKTGQELVADLGICNQDFLQRMHMGKHVEYIKYYVAKEAGILSPLSDDRWTQVEKETRENVVAKLRNRYLEVFGIGF